MPQHTPNHEVCSYCAELKEMAMTLRAVMLRMKLAVKYNGEFHIWKEAGDLHDRVLLPMHWMELCFYNDGVTFEDIYQEAI